MLKFAIIGCGRISFKHVEACAQNLADIQLVATCDHRLDRAQAKSLEFKKLAPEQTAPVAYQDYKQMLAEQKPDVVTVATESGLHAPIVIECLRAGAHVIVEKPMALSTTDAQAMVDVASECGKKLAVCFQNRFNAPIQQIRSAVEAGRFGRLLNAQVQIRWNRNEAYYAEAPWRGTWEMDGGTLMNQCTHGIDVLQWMMGEDAVRVHGVTRRFMRPIEAEDFGAAIVEFASGAVGIIEGSADVYPRNLNETLSVFGTTGTAVVGGLALNKMETWRFADAETVGDSEDKVLNPNAENPPTVYGFGHTALFKDFVDAIKEGREPLCNGEKGKKALDIILAIYRSMKEKAPVDLPHSFDCAEMKGVLDA